VSIKLTLSDPTGRVLWASCVSFSRFVHNVLHGDSVLYDNHFWVYRHPLMIAGPEGTRSACQLQLSSESSTVLVVIGNYKKLQQWIYDFCYQVGMHLKFRHRRRILIGPELIASYIR